MTVEVVEMSSITTVQGEDIAAFVSDGSVMLNDANVIQTHIVTINSVIHVIDQVILPPSMS